MRSFIIENTWLTSMDHGWGNGYVVIPKGHPLHGLSYGEINQLGVDVHHGLTMSDLAENCDNWGDVILPEDKGGWIVGFDTAHYTDILQNWPKEAVQAETDRLRDQLMAYKE